MVAIRSLLVTLRILSFFFEIIFVFSFEGCLTILLLSLSKNIQVLASTVDTNGQLSAEVMERVTAAAAAEPYGSVRHAFVSYGSCISDLSEGWKYRTRLWYGVCIPPKSMCLVVGGVVGCHGSPFLRRTPMETGLNFH